MFKNWRGNAVALKTKWARARRTRKREARRIPLRISVESIPVVGCLLVKTQVCRRTRTVALDHDRMHAGVQSEDEGATAIVVSNSCREGEIDSMARKCKCRLFLYHTACYVRVNALFAPSLGGKGVSAATSFCCFMVDVLATSVPKDELFFSKRRGGIPELRGINGWICPRN